MEALFLFNSNGAIGLLDHWTIGPLAPHHESLSLQRIGNQSYSKECGHMARGMCYVLCGIWYLIFNIWYLVCGTRWK